MHIDLIEKIIARHLRALAEEPAEAPYDWAEFRHRQRSAAIPRSAARNRYAAIAAAVAVAVAVVGVVAFRSDHRHTAALAPADTVAQTSASDRQEQARTRAIERWLAGLPHDPAVVRVGAHAAVSSLQDQIAALDDLLSVERAAGAQPTRLDALERQRAQLVSSLAQVRYAEMLASATP